MSGDEEPIERKRVDNLEVGMVVARPVHSEDGSRLIPAEKEITVEDIDRLKQWDVRNVSVKLDHDE